jgi:hypothetical protein
VSLARGRMVRGRRPGTYEVEALGKADVAKKLRITDPIIRRSRAMAFYGQRLDGMTDGEIAAYWARSREHVNRQINLLTVEQKAEVRARRSRSLRADRMYLEAVGADD